MTQTYFLGANSGRGFYSLYEGFPPDGAFLHIIKGGPGTGKSSFMRALGKAAEERGMDVHYILCSGDPDSLDGVYIPQLHRAWVDGTAPHAAEPGIFGVDSDYVNLGQFCRTPFSPKEHTEILRLTRLYKPLYREAYSLLSAAAAIQQTVPEPEFSEEEQRQIDRLLADADRRPPLRSRRFLHAFTCRGEMALKSEIEKLCKLIMPVSGHTALAYAAQTASGEVILCPSPLCPDRLEAVLLPGRSAAFVSNSFLLPQGPAAPAESCGTVRLDEAREALLAQVLLRLRKAKALHDELEAVCKPYMDFPALTAYTERQVRELLP